MVDKPKGFTSSKFAVAEQVLKALTADYDATMAFGLNAFPPLPGEGTKCDAGRIYVDIDFGTSTKIANAMTTIDPTIKANQNCGTPTGANAEMLGGYAPLLAPGRKHNVILLTDGMPVCGGETVARSVAAIDKLRMQGVPTFVVGFLVGANVSALNMMADAGGQPQAPPAASRFYNAANPDELNFTLRKILSTICAYIPPPQCPTGVSACGGSGIDPAGCPMGTVCASGCCLNLVP
jgi:von Willebrand factor type A domain